jgi:hypothetical protein
MTTPIHPDFLLAETAYHHEQLVASMRRARAPHRASRLRVVQGLIDAIRTHRDPVRGASRYELDGPMVRPAGAPHHATSH